MSSLAILVGVADYVHLTRLSCCPNDVEAINSLVIATNRFDAVHTVIDSDASTLKDTIRNLLKPDTQYQQVFFYFSGHGHSDGNDFYFCLKDFHDKRPNETGLSNRDLHSLLREASPDLVVKVVDACNSGSPLIKAGSDFLPQEKGGLKNVVQIASCLDSQTSLTGEPLSDFTDRFCRAATRKEVGPVYYNDIISILRDEYLSDIERYPHFVFQASARETFVDDASMLSDFREQLSVTWAPKVATPAIIVAPEEAEATSKTSSLSDLLARMESEVAQPQDVSSFVDILFNGIRDKVSADSFGEFYSLKITENSDFEEFETQSFITRVLSKEKRNDEFVTATVKREYKIQNSLTRLTQSLAFPQSPESDYTERLKL